MAYVFYNPNPRYKRTGDCVNGDYSQRYYGRDMGNRNYNRYDRGNSYGRMDGYSRHSGEDLMMRKLQEALDEAHTESERQAIMEYMDQLKH